MTNAVDKTPSERTPLARLRHHFKRRLLIGLVVFTPFAVTIWFLKIVVGFITGLVAHPVGFLADQMGWQKHTEYLVLAVAIVLMVLVLYTIGVLSATFLGRRLIVLLERALRRIPGGEFVYTTIKQIIGMFSLSKSAGTGQRVVVIEFPRKGSYSIGFFSGITMQEQTNEPLVNVFYATTPNPTTGFLLLLPPSEVWETDLTLSDATRFIMSGGVVELAGLRMRPFPIADCLKEVQARRAARAAEAGATAVSLGEAAAVGGTRTGPSRKAARF